jgi:hypothetical protein
VPLCSQVRMQDCKIDGLGWPAHRVRDVGMAGAVPLEPVLSPQSAKFIMSWQSPCCINLVPPFFGFFSLSAMTAPMRTTVDRATEPQQCLRSLTSAHPRSKTLCCLDPRAMISLWVKASRLAQAAARIWSKCLRPASTRWIHKSGSRATCRVSDSGRFGTCHVPMRLHHQSRNEKARYALTVPSDNLPRCPSHRKCQLQVQQPSQTP